MKGPGIIRSLPHVINIIQADIEQFILPFKVCLKKYLFVTFHSFFPCVNKLFWHFDCF